MRIPVVWAALAILWGAISVASETNGAAMDTAKNLCLNGDFENLLAAAARPLPQAWSEYRRGPTARVDVSDDAFQGKHSLRLAAGAGDAVGMNGSVIPIGHGYVRFHYKVLAATAGGGNLALYVIGLRGPSGAEVTRQGYSPPPEHVGDGQWHEAAFEFDFLARHVAHCLVAPRINEAAAAVGEGEWLIDAVEVYARRIGPRVKLAPLWSDKPRARTGETIRFSAWLENDGDEDVSEVSVRLTASAGVKVRQPPRTAARLPVGSYARVDWDLLAESPGAVTMQATATYRGSESEAAVVTEPASYRVLVIDRRRRYTRQELCTDEIGYWRLLPRPATLQESNSAPLTRVRHKRSSEIGSSPYGLCIQLPRAKDYEDPFNPVHLIDGDPDTCWSSQQNASMYPGRPPWAEIDLGRAVTISQVNLLPYWRNTDFPLGFTLRTSRDGKRWDAAFRTADYRFADSAPLRGDKKAQLFPLGRAVTARYVRVDFERLPLSGGNYAEMSQGYKARLSGIEVLDDRGDNVALARRGATIKVNDVFTGWQNTAEQVRQSFDRLADLGVKWVRVGQWGDQTEWAAVERKQGEFRMDPATDAAIRYLHDNGIDILYGLNYGNALYDRPEQPGDIGPIFTEGHPFYLNWGPRTEAGRQAFVRYVDFVVRKYQDCVKYWELWNEENGWYPGHEPELYGKLLLAVAQHIKSIAPNLEVVFGGTAAPAPLTTEIALREGAAPYVDAYAFHPYGIDKPEGGMGTMEYYQGQNLSQSREQTGWNRLEDIVAGVRRPFAEHGKPTVEVWLNEWNTGGVSGLDYAFRGCGEYAAAKYLLRFYIYSGWLNLRTAWWSLYTANMSQDWGILDPHDYGLRPLSYALQNVCSVVSDVTPLRTLDYQCAGDAPDPKVIAYRRDGGETLILVWGAEPGTEEVRSYPSTLSFALKSAPAQVTLTDLYWGLSQPAKWSYENGRVTLDHLIVRDYPVVITCR